MKELLRLNKFVTTGSGSCVCSVIVIFLLTVAGGKPIRLLPRHALEKFYHEMIQTSGSAENSIKQITVQETDQNREALKGLYSRQYTPFDFQGTGSTARVLIYSITSKRYLSVRGAEVDGKGSRQSKYATIIIESIGFNKFKLKGENSKTYICFDARGKLEGRKNGNQPDCIFNQYPLTNHYTAFRSVSRRIKWIGVRPKGTIKRASRTKRGQRATKFVILTS